MHKVYSRKITGIATRTICTRAAIRVSYQNDPEDPNIRNKLNKLYYNKNNEITGDELKVILKGRRPMLNVANDEIVLEIQEKQWNAEEILWDSLADILNEWSCGTIIRNATINDNDPNIIVPLKIHGMFIRDMPQYPDF